jgi:Domain of unknown function (DUF4365)
LLPQQSIEEQLSLAHVQAIAAQTGVSMSYFNLDYGIDGTFRSIIRTQGSRYVTSGAAIDFQLKASINCLIEPEHIVCDLEVKTYNDLIDRRINGRGSIVPCILLLKVLPTDPINWLSVSEESANLKGGCYWDYLSGRISNNNRTVRIRIPRNQLFSPEPLQWMFNQISIGAWP